MVAVQRVDPVLRGAVGIEVGQHEERLALGQHAVDDRLAVGEVARREVARIDQLERGGEFRVGRRERRRRVAVPPALGDLGGRQAEDEDVVGTHLLADLDGIQKQFS